MNMDELTIQTHRAPQGSLSQSLSQLREWLAAGFSPVNHVEFQDGMRGITYDKLFGRYLAGARRIDIQDPYIQRFHQARNLMELLETIVRHRTNDRKIAVRLVTAQTEPEYVEQQLKFLQSMEVTGLTQGIWFSWEFDASVHDRSIMTDTGWKIILGRGLDIFRWFDVNDAFDFQNRLQGCRAVRGFYVTYVRVA